MRLAELEPESFLRLDLQVVGNVATDRLGNLWKPNNYLCQPDVGAIEAEIPELDGWKGTDIFSYQGFTNLSTSCFVLTSHQGEGYYNAYEKDIAVLNLFFGQPTVYGGLKSFESVQVDVTAQLVDNFVTTWQ